MGLKVLDVSNNRLRELANLSGLTRLEDLWLSHNQIASFVQMGELLPTTSLQCVYLEHNPAVGECENYKAMVLSALPHLQQLDADPV